MRATFLVWYTMEYSTSHLYFSVYKGAFTMTERCITILYHAIENTVANTINATYARRMMGRFL